MSPLPHLFRTEYSKVVSVLCRYFGAENIQAAEDVAADTFLAAAETWGLKGTPPNPAAWLYTVAKNKAKDHMKHAAVFRDKVSPQLIYKGNDAEQAEVDLSEKNITDSQLQMMFAVCHPCIAPEAQTGLALRILCGFGIEEIADAFLTNKETIKKRLLRAKEKLRTEKISIEMPPEAELRERLESVLRTIYLLFNEGYYSNGSDLVLRKDLCLEAMRLNYLLLENKITDQPAVNALMALMCFHASRFEARLNESGEIILYEDQDESLWNKELIGKGKYFLNRASAGKEVHRYHLEAAIARFHTDKADTKEKWENILQLYNRLLQLSYSPVAALNRTYALYKLEGESTAIAAAEKLGLEKHHLYHLLMSELYKKTDREKATECLLNALSFVKTDGDRKMIRRKMDLIG